MKKYFLLLILAVALIGEANAQLGQVNAQFYSTQYRTPGQNWKQLQTERFRIIYPGRFDSLARETLAILELEYDGIQSLVGGELRDFPVILNPDNDRSNGFVSPFNFRSEIEIAPFLGKSLNPQSGTWLETVLPHELVHALHFSVNNPSIVRPLGLFSPDVRRSIHAATPFGFIEGVAVEHESHGVIGGAGRGNYPYFSNQFYAMQGAGEPWSMGQLVHTTTYTPPFNRHYIGGYQFVNWLQNRYGEGAMEEAIRKHYQLPFLGFGFALRRSTGEWPGELYNEFMEKEDDDYAEIISNLETDTDYLSDEIPLNATCRRASRPVWLSDSEILFYSRACNRPSGFYQYVTGSQTSEYFHEVSITGDHHFSLSPDRSALLYSRFYADPKYDNSFLADVHELNLETGVDRRLTKHGRVVSPDYWSGQIVAAQTEGQTRKLVVINPQTGDVTRTFSKAANSSVITVEINPAGAADAPAAVLGNKNGVQAIWFEDLTTDEPLFSGAPDIVFEDASIFDPSWGETGSTLYFSADRGNAMNIYAYGMDTKTIRRVTDTRYVAMEGSLSPDGSQLAYIYQNKNEQLPAVLNADDFHNEEVPQGEWGPTENIRAKLDRPLLNEQNAFEALDTDEWEESEYSTGLSWLKPRLWLPSVDGIIDDVDQVGVSLESADRLSQNSYSLEFNYFRQAFWFDGTYRYKGTYPGFELNLYNRPSVAVFSFSDENEENQILPTIAQQRGGTFSVPFRYRLEQNTRFSSFVIEPEFSARQIRFNNFDDASQPISEYDQPLYTLGLNTTLNLGLRQYSRDVQPNRGVQLFTQTRYGLNSSEYTLRLPGGASTNPLSRRRGFRAGAVWYAAPLSRLNQSLRVGVQGFTQTSALVFDTESVISNLFETGTTSGATETGVLDTRYTIPLTYPDDGGLLLPVYLSNVYMVLFTQTVADLDKINRSARTVLGAGIRSKFKIGNLQFDIGIALGWEPGKNRVNDLVGSF